MRKIRLFLVLLLCVFVVNTYAQVELKLNNSFQKEFSILEKSPYKIKVKSSLNAIKTQTVSTVSGNFMELGCPGFSKTYNNLGKPQLPVLNKLIEVPYGAEIEINVISYNEQTIQLADKGLVNRIMPVQPSVSKSANINEIPFYYDQAFYQANAFNTADMVTVTMSGIMRGVRMANMSVAPFRYNPVTNTLKVYNDLVFEVVFKHPDITLTEQMKEKYYSPYFESSLNTMVNHTAPLAKDVITKYPVKYVIVSLTTFQSALQPFVYWKRQKGFNVIEQYYATVPTTATIKTFLTGLYTSGTSADPAPTFVLLVGDVAQIPTYTGVADASHKTDLYYCTFDSPSDYLPDMYYGRFSATTLIQLQPQIDKTLEYEKYLMPDPSYLDTCVMIAGVDDGTQPDGGYSQVYGNGQINYGTNNYFNGAHGLYSFTYLWPASNVASNDILIRNEIGTGVSYANYTAHGSSAGWADPSFLTSHVAAMHNTHKYCLMVGNCCQTNTFNDTECFGEALLRAANKGAMGYIGASNYSYWDEDYYFGVGNRSSIIENPTYDASNLGAYDRMFHDKAGIPKTSWFYTNDQMVYAGNLAVEASSSSMKKYYWEIYHLMGDPSVMTYFSVPDTMKVIYTSPQNVGITSLVVNTVEDAYVAISHAGVLLDAELAPVGGITTLNFAAINQADTLDVVVTKQNKQPYIGTLIIQAPSIPLDAQLVSINNPTGTYNCTGISVVPQVTVRNAGTTTLTSFRITYQITGGSQQIFNWTGSLASGQTVNIDLSAVTIPAGTGSFTATTSLPNGSADQNTANDSQTKAISAASLPISSDFSGSATESCAAPLSVSFTNSSTNANSYLWDFGDGTTSTEANPTHNYTALGAYTVVLTADAGICGNDVETKAAYINVGTDAPIGFGEDRCGPGILTVNANGSGTLNWYDALTGGNLLTTGTSYTTPFLNSSTTYYVESIIDGGTANTARTNWAATNTTNISAEQGLVFNALQTFVLKSVKVYSNATGTTTKTISLKNASGTLSTINASVPTGESRVTLNFTVPVENGLKLVAAANSYLVRENNLSTSIYPMTLPDILSITTTTASTAPQTYYYYFYDWEIELPDCSSARTGVTATILSAPPIAQFTFSQNNAIVDFTNTSSNGDSYYWDFGDGSSTTTASPSHTYGANGTYNVMLVTTNNCSSDTVYQQVTILITGVEENGLSKIEVFPNPVRDVVTINFNKVKADKVVLTDVIGKKLLTLESIQDKTSINIASYKAGVYFLNIYAEGKTVTYRINKID